MIKLFFLLLIFTSIIKPQQTDSASGVPEDTSYTIYSATAKMKKKFPDAVPVSSVLPSDVKEAKNIVYTEIGKRELHLDIFYPAKQGNEKYPAVILIHGGGWQSGERSMVYPVAERLAGKGYFSIAIEYRLSIEALYPAAVYDIKSAIRWIIGVMECWSDGMLG